MKTKFDNGQCAHVWAQRTQAYGSSNSMRFEGLTLYSYRTPIACLYPLAQAMSVQAGSENVVALLTSETYSITTSGKHMPAARRAVSNLRQFYVPYVVIDSQSMHTHADNLGALRKAWHEESDRLQRQRDVPHFDRLRDFARDSRDYARAFNLPAGDAISTDACEDRTQLIIADRAAREERNNTPAKIAARERAAAAKEVKLAAANAARVQRELLSLGEWRDGDRQTWYGTDALNGAYLRLRNGEVQTSRGASVPQSEALRAIRFIRVVIARGTPWTRNGETCPVGQFQIDRIAANGNIHAGCHFIQYGEIDRIATLLGC